MITPNWNVPAHIKAFSTIRAGGYSKAPFKSNNLGLHVGDDASLVALNRHQLSELLPTSPVWLEQQHTNLVWDCNNNSGNGSIVADASVSTVSNKVCCVMTADCLPILLTNRQGNQVAAVHAGWRGLCDGIVENTLAKFGDKPQDIIAWLGPAIGSSAFEVGNDVVELFCRQYPQDQCCFIQHGQKYLANIYQLARARLQRFGVTEISGGEYCTFSDSQQFFSYRRDGQTGRMATLIWISH